MSTDPTAITTEIPVAAAPAGVAVRSAQDAGPGPDAGPGASMDGQSATGIEPCPHCGSPLALDQRYCLECGAPRTYLSGMLLERLRTPAGQAQPGAPGQAAQAPPPNGVAPYGTAPSSPAWPRNNVLTLIAGVGVLLLAMGVGVLIGRSGGQSSAAGPAPQVITVGGAATGAASTATTPTTTTPEEAASSTKQSGSGAAARQSKSKAKLAPGVGSSPSKPAPSTVLKNLHSGSQQEREQKSKNLPNVVSTG